MADNQLPESVVDEAVRLTRLAERAPESAPPGAFGEETTLSEADRYRRERTELLREQEFRARLREDDSGLTLVCYPAEWLQNGEIDLAAVEDTDRAIERRIDGTGGSDTWEPVAEHNREVATAVASRYGDPHARTARSFGRFMASHRVRRVETATAEDILEFVEEFFPRNTWPTDAQQAVVMRSIRLTIAAATDGLAFDEERGS